MRKKQEIISFKVDPALMQSLEGIENRSEFIRAAILSALDNTCPLCKGTGIMTPDQQRHWVEFSRHHQLTECGDCHALHLECTVQSQGKA